MFKGDNMLGFIEGLRTLLLNYIKTRINVLLKAKIIQCNHKTYLPIFLLRVYETYIKIYKMQVDKLSSQATKINTNESKKRTITYKFAPHKRF